MAYNFKILKTLFMNGSLVLEYIFSSWVAKAGNDITGNKEASTSLEVEALGSKVSKILRFLLCASMST